MIPPKEHERHKHAEFGAIAVFTPHSPLQATGLNATSKLEKDPVWGQPIGRSLEGARR